MNGIITLRYVCKWSASFSVLTLLDGQWEKYPLHRSHKILRQKVQRISAGTREKKKIDRNRITQFHLENVAKMKVVMLLIRDATSNKFEQYFTTQNFLLSVTISTYGYVRSSYFRSLPNANEYFLIQNCVFNPQVLLSLA